MTDESESISFSEFAAAEDTSMAATAQCARILNMFVIVLDVLQIEAKNCKFELLSCEDKC